MIVQLLAYICSGMDILSIHIIEEGNIIMIKTSMECTIKISIVYSEYLLHDIPDSGLGCLCS